MMDDEVEWGGNEDGYTWYIGEIEIVLMIGDMIWDGG